MTMETIQPVEKKGNSKVLIIAGVFALLCLCIVVASATTFLVIKPALQSVYEQAFGYTGIADEQLKLDVLKGISDHEPSQNGCADVTMVNGHMFLRPEQTEDGSWSETWQVMVCGDSRLYLIFFTPSPLGGTDFSVSRIDE
jgi:hypothetical protein